MKRFRRIVLKGLTVLSLGLALLVAASWVRSYWRYDEIDFVSGVPRTGHWLAAPKGRVVWSIFHGDLTNLFSKTQHGFSHKSSVAQNAGRLPHTFLGFGWMHKTDPSISNPASAEVSIPHAYLVLLFAALPAIRFYGWFRRPRVVLPGHCRKCGYDLRATPDRCPECGTAASPAMAK